MDPRDFSAPLAAQAEVVARLRGVDSPEAREEVANALWDTGCMLQLKGQLEASAAAFDEVLLVTAGHSDEPELFGVVESVLLVRTGNAEEAGQDEEVEALKRCLVEHRANWAQPAKDPRGLAELYAAAERHSDGGEPGEALSVLSLALRPYDDGELTPLPEDLPWVVRCFALLGSLAEHHQQPDGARVAYDQALRLSADTDDPDLKSLAEWTDARRGGLPGPSQ